MISYTYAWKEFVGNQSIFQKALKCGWYAMYRNIENGSLIVYWAYSIGWKIYGYFLRRSSNKSILEAMFPRGLFQFMIGQIRTMSLLYGFGFIFWITMGIAGTLKLNKDGLTKDMTTFLIMITAILSINIETKKAINLEKVIELMEKTPGIKLVDRREDGGYVTPDETAGEDDVFVSRVRIDNTVKNGLAFWVVADNLRKGAALNSIQIAEELIKKYI